MPYYVMIIKMREKLLANEAKLESKLLREQRVLRKTGSHLRLYPDFKQEPESI